MRENYFDYDVKDISFPKKIYIEPTDMCNLNCSICFRHGWISEELGMMDMSVFNTFASQINDIPFVEEVFFGGMGEPLFHPDICKMLKSFSTGIKKTLITNGSMLNKEKSRNLVEAGLDELWISMDGFCKESYESIQNGGMYEQLIKSIEGFNEIRDTEEKASGRRINLCITFVITPQNIDELSHIDEFADYYDIDWINISHMIPGYPMKETELLYDKRDVPLGKMHRMRDGALRVPEDECPFISKNCMFIRWDGKAAPCMQLLHSCRTYLFEEERIITSFTYGNVEKQSVLDCWNDEEYRRFRGRVKEFYFPFCRHCSGCEDRKGNLKDCFLTESPTCGACIWASGRVFCP